MKTFLAFITGLFVGAIGYAVILLSDKSIRNSFNAYADGMENED